MKAKAQTPPPTDLKAQLLYTPAEIAALFRQDDKSPRCALKWVYRQASHGGFLAPFARKFNGKLLLFDKAGIDRLLKGT